MPTVSELGPHQMLQIFSGSQPENVSVEEIGSLGPVEEEDYQELFVGGEADIESFKQAEETKASRYDRVEEERRDRYPEARDAFLQELDHLVDALRTRR